MIREIALSRRGIFRSCHLARWLYSLASEAVSWDVPDYGTRPLAAVDAHLCCLVVRLAWMKRRISQTEDKQIFVFFIYI